MTALPTIILGPALRPEGRDYGLRRKPTSLSAQTGVLLEDLALSLLEWGKRGEPQFAALLWLPSDSQYLLLKGVHLGRGSLGPIAVAHGVLVTKAVLDGIDGRGHLLLPLIPEPTMAEWTAAFVELPDAGPVAPPAPPASQAVDLIVRQLADTAGRWPGVCVSGEDGGEVQQELLEAMLWNRTKARPTWSTTDLPPISRFTLDKVSLVMRRSEKARPGEIHLRSGRVVGGLAGVSPGFQLFERVFSLPGGEGRYSKYAIKAVRTAKWDDSYRQLPMGRMVSYALDDLLGSGLSTSDFWDVLEILARNIAALAGADERREASLGLTALFSSAPKDDPLGFGPLLENYMDRIWPVLPYQKDLPLQLALERDVLGAVEARLLSRLLDEGLATRFPERFSAILQSHVGRRADDPARLKLESAALLLQSLNRSYAQAGVSVVPVATMAAATALSTELAARSAPGSEPAGLYPALARQAELLTSLELIKDAAWPRLVRSWLPGLVRLLRARAPDSALLKSWIGSASDDLRRDPTQFSFTRSGLPSRAVLRDLLVCHALVAPSKPGAST